MLAVLPFQDLSPDSGEEYFSDRLTEETKPDSRLVAYTSNESRRTEIYVEAFLPRKATGRFQPRVALNDHYGEVAAKSCTYLSAINGCRRENPTRVHLSSVSQGCRLTCAWNRQGGRTAYQVADNGRGFSENLPIESSSPHDDKP
jgi:hypothetical protein